MTRHQIIVIVVALLVTVGLYHVPRVVVENETGEIVEQSSHELTISDIDEATLQALREQLKASSEIKKSVNFADSLASLYLKYRLLDSAENYAELILTLDSSEYAKQKSALIFYQAFRVADNMEKAKLNAERAREIFEELLKTDPQNSSLKNKLAMTLITSENPMQGIQILREVLATDPENREATLNLGLLAIQSGQYERAAERFLVLYTRDSSDNESIFYYGVALAEQGETDSAKNVFNIIVGRPDADPALRATASTYLEEL